MRRWRQARHDVASECRAGRRPGHLSRDALIQLRGKKRILVLGCPGAGKSFLARRLARLLGLPIIHLDQEYWQPDWVEPDAREWKRIVPQLAERPTWVMDGNYAGSLPVRLQACDAALFLDFPTWACFRGIASRRWRGGERLDMAAGCHERFNLEFYRFVWGFRRESRPKVVAQLEASEKPQLWMTHRAQVDTLLQRVSSEVA